MRSVLRMMAQVDDRGSECACTCMSWTSKNCCSDLTCSQTQSITIRAYMPKSTPNTKLEKQCVYGFLGINSPPARMPSSRAKYVCSPKQAGRLRRERPSYRQGTYPASPGLGGFQAAPHSAPLSPPQSPSRLPPPPPHPTANRTSSLLPSHVRIAHHGRALPSSIAIHLPTITRWTHVRNRELVHIRRRYCLELHQVKFRYAMLNTAPWKCTLACGTPMPTCWCPGPSSQPRLLTLHQDEQMSRP